MPNNRRVFFATMLGFVAGMLCFLINSGSISTYHPWMIFITIFNRTFIGFCIGVSGLRWNWALHGLFWGLFVSLMIAIPAWRGFNSQVFYLLTIAGALWGFLIELFTSKVFKAPAVKNA